MTAGGSGRRRGSCRRIFIPPFCFAKGWGARQRMGHPAGARLQKTHICQKQANMGPPIASESAVSKETTCLIAFPG